MGQRLQIYHLRCIIRPRYEISRTHIVEMLENTYLLVNTFEVIKKACLLFAHTSTVGLPRESKISRALTLDIFAMSN